MRPLILPALLAVLASAAALAPVARAELILVDGQVALRQAGVPHADPRHDHEPRRGALRRARDPLCRRRPAADHALGLPRLLGLFRARPGAAHRRPRLLRRPRRPRLTRGGNPPPRPSARAAGLPSRGATVSSRARSRPASPPDAAHRIPVPSPADHAGPLQPHRSRRRHARWCAGTSSMAARPRWRWPRPRPADSRPWVVVEPDSRSLERPHGPSSRSSRRRPCDC